MRHSARHPADKPATRPADKPGRKGRRPPVVGIVGGLGSGKSTVARLLAQRGAQVVDADRIAHAALDREDIRQALAKAFGDGVLDEAGRVSRERLAQQAFASSQQTERLNRIVHPPTIEEMRRQVEACSSRADVPLVAVDAALLIETGLDESLCDAVLFVEARPETRRARAGCRAGLTEEQFKKREQHQMPVEDKRSRADYVVSNTGTIEELEDQLDRLWPELCRLRPSARRSTACEQGRP